MTSDLAKIESGCRGHYIWEKASQAEVRYLVRFDDLCPTMNWEVWERIEGLLLQHGIKPLLAVVPDNRDPDLMVNQAREDFWGRVRKWQARGWTIALHGFQHRYVNRNAGVLGITSQSEFAGLPRQEQEIKLRAGLKKFADEGVEAQAWIAPSHSFDRVTLEVLSRLGLRVISDGLSILPFLQNGVTWVPQQLWENFRPRARGVWTVCCHSNHWTKSKLERFSREVVEFRNQITSIEEVLCRWPARARDLRDRFYELQWRARAGWWRYRKTVTGV